jgi:hypothetical protein
MELVTQFTHFARRILTTTLTTKGADAGAKCTL